MGTKLTGLHIIRGDSAAGCFKEAFKADDHLLIEQDSLSCGPTPSGLDSAQWEEVRLKFWRQVHPSWTSLSFGSDAPYRNVDRLRQGEAIYLWVGTGLDDQLMVAYILNLMEHAGGDWRRVHLVQFEHVSNGFPVRGMGLVNPEQMRKHPAPLLITERQMLQYRAIWGALTADTPAHLLELCSDRAEIHPRLRAALGCVLQRYPQRGNGLGYWDQQLLLHARVHSPSAAKIIGYTLGHSFDGADTVGDGYLIWKMHKLSSSLLPEPLLTVSGGQELLRDMKVALTQFGAGVLDGKQSFHPANPIDEWIGGVHLSSSEGRLWFLENGKLTDS